MHVHLLLSVVLADASTSLLTAEPYTEARLKEYSV